jgi:phosphoribosylformylglycinamidine cyclo-ligase
LYFLDYIACGKNDPAKLEQVVAGVADGCVQADVALVGGETAEMPGMYGPEEYDLAGFAVGVAEKANLIDGEKNVSEGDILIGLPSNGLHSNGYSLVRKVFADFGMDTLFPELGGPLIDELLKPTRIYVRELLPLLRGNLVNGIAHITGGGFVENIPRMFGSYLSAQIHEGTWPVLPIFGLLEKLGGIEHSEMFEIFNMGLGIVMAVSPSKLDAVKAELRESGSEFYEIGQMVARSGDADDATDATGKVVVIK